MGTNGLIWLMTLVIGELPISFECTEQVDLIELNHFHDSLGRHVYDQ